MSLTQIIYLVYLHILGLPLFLALFLFGWKKAIVDANLSQLGLPQPVTFRIHFYHHLLLDLLKLLHGNYGRAIRVRAGDQHKLVRLKSGSSLFLSAHFHNWELMGSWLSNTLHIPLLSVALPFKNPTSSFLLRKLRNRLRIQVIDSDITRSALRHIQSGNCLGMIWDQYPSRGDLTALFFFIPLRVDPLPGFLAEKSFAPVFFGVLLPGGQFRLVQIFHPKTTSITPSILARRYHRVLEILVRAYPHYWYGLAHRRFKDQTSYEISRSVSRETTSHNSV
jgi:lauroyl/myristoyl acyltransferase